MKFGPSYFIWGSPNKKEPLDSGLHFDAFKGEREKKHLPLRKKDNFGFFTFRWFYAPLKQRSLGISFGNPIADFCSAPRGVTRNRCKATSYDAYYLY